MSQEIGHSATFLKLLSTFSGVVAYEKSEGELHKEKRKRDPSSDFEAGHLLGGVSANRVTQPKVEQ
jgi:hypothetical protein